MVINITEESVPKYPGVISHVNNIDSSSHSQFTSFCEWKDSTKDMLVSQSCNEKKHHKAVCDTLYTSINSDQN